MINEYTNLKLTNGRRIHYNKLVIEKLKRDIAKTLSNYNIKRHTKDFFIPVEIYYNNAIEGYYDDYKEILEELISSTSLHYEKRNRIINSFNAYDYILQKPEITKDNLKHLYDLISKDILEESSLKNMGEYYRNNGVCIINNGLFDIDKGVDEDKVEEYMSNLYTYLDNDTSKDKIDEFIRSQIIHFYFVYIHPYFDGNGRTARTLSMWYLLEKESYPFLLFNRAIFLHKHEYLKLIRKARKTGDLTKFLAFMLKRVKEELEKDMIIDNIEYLSENEKRVIEYYLSLDNKTIKNLASFYNRDPHLSINKTISEVIMPLIDKDILQITKELKETNDFVIELNPKYIKEVSYGPRTYRKINQRTT